MSFPQTERTTSLRKPENLSYDEATAYAILDEAYVCHVGYATDGTPRVLPTVHARIGDRLYFHGSSGSRAMLSGRDDGVDVCITVTIHDGLVFGKSWFHHSTNYRCVMAHGRAVPVNDETEKWDALAAIVDAFAPGRSIRSRPPTGRELAQTAVLTLPLQEVSVRIRSGGPNDDPEDIPLDFWAGEVPLTTTPGPATPAPGVGGPPPADLPGQWEAAAVGSITTRSDSAHTRGRR